MFGKKIFSVLCLLFIGKQLKFVSGADCNVNDGSNCLINSYYLVDKIDYSIITETETDGILYYCKGDPVQCSEIKNVGYLVIDKTTNYVCKNTVNGFVCQKGEEITTGECTDKENNGKLVGVSDSTDTIKFCLNESTPGIELNSSNSGNYLVTKNDNTDSNIFGISGSSEKYAIVTIKDKVITLNDSYTNNMKYVYANSETSKVMEKGDGTCPKDAATNNPDESKILEVSCTKGICMNADDELVITGATGIIIKKLDENGNPVALSDNDLHEANLIANAEGYKEKMRMYNCNSDNVCNMVSGYFLTDDDDGSDVYYAITEEGATAVATNAQAKCTKENIGEVITTDGSAFSICLDDDLSVVVTNGAGAGKYILGDGTGVGPFASNGKKMVEVGSNSDSIKLIYVDTEFEAENNKDYVVKVDTKYYVYKYSQSSSTFTMDTDLSSPKNYKLHAAGSNIYDEYALTDTSLITLDTDIVNWALFNCKEGSCMPTYGYMKSLNENKYFKYSEDARTANAIVSRGFPADCGAGSAYNIKEDGTLCIVGSATEGDRRYGEMKNGNVYVVPTADEVASLFKRVATEHVAVVATDHSLTFENIEKSTIITADHKKISTLNIDNNNKNKLILYNCNHNPADLKCERIEGYILKKNSYYTTGTDGASAEFTPVTLTSVTDTGCCTGHVGKLGTFQNEIYLCLTGDLAVNIKKKGNYVLGTPESGTVFNGKVNNMIKIEDEYIILNPVTAANDENYIVKVNDNTLINYLTSDTGATYTDTAKISIYKAMEGYTNIYEEVLPATIAAVTGVTDLEGYLLFNCKTGATGGCTEKVGYIVAGTSDAEAVYTNISGAWVKRTTETAENCTAAADVGNIKVDTNVIQLCMPTPAFAAPSAGAPYMLKKGNTAYKIYYDNGTDSKIVIEENPGVGHYIVNATFDIDTSGTDNSTGKLISCSGETVTCTEKAISAVVEAEYGYYRNGYDPTKIISCESTPPIKCKNNTPDAVTLYKTVDSKYAYWDGTMVVEVTPTAASCSANTIGQLTTDGKLCLNGSKTGGFVETPANYLLYYHENSAFANTVSLATDLNPPNYGVVKATKNTIAIDTTINGGDYCVNKETFVVTAISGSNCAATHNRFSCSSGVCTANIRLPACDSASAKSSQCDDSLQTVTTLCVKDNLQSIFLSTTTTSCADSSSSFNTNGNYYIFKCTNGITCTHVSDVSTLTATDELLLYKYVTPTLVQQKDASYFVSNKVINCDAEGKCRLVNSATPANTYYFNVAATNLEDAIYQCTGTSSVTCSAVTATDNYSYLDAGNPMKVISCANSTCKSAAGSIGGHVYIDARESTGKKRNLIICARYGGCISFAGSTTAGHAYKDGIASGANYPNVITCTDADGCASAAGSSTTGHAYIDAADSGNKYVIVCNGTTCTTSIGSTTAGHAYISGIASGANYPNVITCTEANGCASAAGSSTTGHAYIDATDSANTYAKVIICNGTTCASEAGSTTSSNAYINAIKDASNKNPNIIDCYTTSGQCVSQTGSSTYTDAKTGSNTITCADGNCTSAPTG